MCVEIKNTPLKGCFLCEEMRSKDNKEMDSWLCRNDKLVRLLRRPSTGSLAMTNNKEMDFCLRRNDRGEIPLTPLYQGGEILDSRLRGNDKKVARNGKLISISATAAGSADAVTAAGGTECAVAESSHFLLAFAVFP